MDGDGSRTDATNPASAASPAPTRGVCYAGDASPIDVMFDQLEYLVAHASSHCSPGCLNCQRFERVKNWLLAPFRPAQETGSELGVSTSADAARLKSVLHVGLGSPAAVRRTPTERYRP